MNFNPEWNIIQRFDETIPQSVVDEVTDILFTPDPPEEMLAQAEICVILGSRNCEYKATRASELFSAKQALLYIACGANAAESGLPEAELMRNTLIAEGVSPQRVLIDGHSNNTMENLRNAEQLIIHTVGDPREMNIVIVSSWFHRLHVHASLPKSLKHAFYVSAAGPFAAKESWHTNPVGRGVIFHELMRPNLHRNLKADNFQYY